jgi:hypothetical protein
MGIPLLYYRFYSYCVCRITPWGFAPSNICDCWPHITSVPENSWRWCVSHLASLRVRHTVINCRTNLKIRSGRSSLITLHICQSSWNSMNWFKIWKPNHACGQHVSLVTVLSFPRNEIMRARELEGAYAFMTIFASMKVKCVIRAQIN